MPRIGAATKDRSCLVCGGKTTVAHMGLDVCRACTVFYRRSVGRTYACRSNSNECPIGPDGVNCRKCRYDNIDRVVRESGVLNLGKSSESDVSQDNEPSSSRVDAETTQADPFLTASNQRPILARMRSGYKTMSEIRFISELNLRPNPPHPMEMKLRENQFYPATVMSMNTTNRVFLSAVMPFATSAFPEFDGFRDEQQWSIIKNFFFRFRPFESTWRADKAFPENMDRTLGSYTTYIASENADIFLSDCPNHNVNIEDAKRLMWNISKEAFVKNRTFMARLKPDLEEFLAIVGIMFWTLEGLQVSEEAVHVSERYRTDILQELHFYYREELGMEDYAARLGELLTLVQIFEKSEDMKEFFELLRLLNVFSDDTFGYRFIKE
ncbi:hypothetical protein PRIPAC_83037 [Pristionchus pacificus]|nr:hypothetical protein PRIPAC_83037 [Pristionchus pacificus]